MDDTRVLLLVLLATAVPFGLVLVMMAQTARPKWPHKFRTLKIVTGRVVSVKTQQDTAGGGNGLVARIATSESGPGYAYEVLNQRVYRELVRRKGEQVTVRTGIYPGLSGARWVIEVIE